MKKTILFFILLTFARLASAQDIIVKKDGSTIMSKVTEIGKTEVKYKKFSNQNGPTYTLSVSDIFSINYENGEKEAFENNNSNVQTESDEHLLIQKEGDNRNAQIKDLYSRTYSLSKSKTPEKSKAKEMICFFSASPTCIMSNDEIECTIEENVDDNPLYNRLYLFTRGLYNIIVRNKTNKPIYIDLANTFRMASNGRQRCFYNNEEVVSSEGSGRSGSLNMGGIAGSLGIGGLAGGIMSGLTLGGSSSTSTSTIHHQDRILIVPPNGTRKMIDIDPYKYDKDMWGRSYYATRNSLEYFSQNFAGITITKNGDIDGDISPKGIDAKINSIHINESVIFNRENSPLTVDYQILYSTSNNFKTYSYLTPSFYLSQVIGIEKTFSGYTLKVRNDPADYIKEFDKYTLIGITKTKK